MKKYITILISCISFVSFGQNPNEDSQELTVTGKVVEESTNAALEYATIAITNPQGEIVTGGITDLDGNYSIRVPVGLYNITFEFIGFETKTLKNQNLAKDTSLPTINLAEDLESLDEVIVRAEITEVQVRLDKKIYNIGKDLTTSGATVGDALSNVPSVTVDV